MAGAAVASSESFYRCQDVRQTFNNSLNPSFLPSFRASDYHSRHSVRTYACMYRASCQPLVLVVVVAVAAFSCWLPSYSSVILIETCKFWVRFNWLTFSPHMFVVVIIIIIIGPWCSCGCTQSCSQDSQSATMTTQTTFSPALTDDHCVILHVIGDLSM